MEILKRDIVIVGGGTAGSAAAIAAARRGHSVLLVEEQNCLGGTSAAGGVSEWFASIEGLGDIFESVKRELERYGARSGRSFNPECLKLAWQLLAESAGVDLLFHASAIQATCDKRRVERVRIASCSKQMDVEALIFIDASGEGDLAALAGAEYMLGHPDSGLTLHMTLAAWMYDTGKPVTPYLPDGLEPIQDPADLPGLGRGHRHDDGRVYLNATKVVRHDPTDPFSLSEAECEARRQLIRVIHYLQRTEFPTHALGGTGARIGIREGRRIIGDYVLTQDDVLSRSEPLTFEDGVAVATSQVDFHSLTKPGNSGWRQRLIPYNIPFRCLLVKDRSNLLTAGKCISTDQVVHSSCRMTPTCCAMGQAAGTAAALAVEANLSDIRELSVAHLRDVLMADGMELDPSKHQAFSSRETRLEEDNS